MTYFNWQTTKLKPRVAPYNRLSPNLALIREEIGKRFGGSSLGGYANYIRLTPGGSPSSHAFGAAFDWGNWPRGGKQAAIDWLVANYEALHVQFIGDYQNDRIWKRERYPLQPRDSWWRPYSLPAGTWIHVETGPVGQGFEDVTPIGVRLGQGVPPLPVVDKTTQPKPRLRKVNSTVPPLLQSATRYLQSVIGATVDGDFGPQTDRLVRAFQKKHGLTVDGIVGVYTWAVVDREAP